MKIISKTYDSYLRLTGLSGVIDPILETFPRLKLLRLGRNHLRSTIPPLPPSLRALAVPNNALNGTIPPLNNNFTLLYVDFYRLLCLKKKLFSQKYIYIYILETLQTIV